MYSKVRIGLSEARVDGKTEWFADIVGMAIGHGDIKLINVRVVEDRETSIVFDVTYNVGKDLALLFAQVEIFNGEMPTA